MVVAIENKQQNTQKTTTHKTKQQQQTTNKQTPTQNPQNYFVIHHSLTDPFS